MKRCIHCKGGKVPERIKVLVMKVFQQPAMRITVLQCPWCENELSTWSLGRLNGLTVEPSAYR